METQAPNAANEPQLTEIEETKMPGASMGNVEVQLGETQEMELPQIDLTQFVGRKAKIVAVKEYQGTWGYYIRAETELLDEAKNIRASRLFGLNEIGGKIGWGSKTELAAFLKHKGVLHYRQLVGKEVLVQTKSSKKDKTKLFLTFI